MTHLSVIYWKRCVRVHCYEDVSNICLQHEDEATASNKLLASNVRDPISKAHKSRMISRFQKLEMGENQYQI